MLGKTEAKLLTTEEKCEKLSTHMKSEISRQVGDIEATEAAQRKQTENIRVELEDKLIQIEKLKDKILEEKTKFEEQGEVIIGLKDEIYAANKQVKSQDKKLANAKLQGDEKLVEIDKLYNETDFLKNELSNIRAKYDFS